MRRESRTRLPWSPPVRAFAAVMLAVLLAQSAWILVVPPFRGLDEHEHAYKAAAVAAGDWGWHHRPSAQGWGALVTVPAALTRAAAPVCESLSYTTSDNCRGRPTEGGVEVASSASQYNPAYYGVVGTVARPFSGTASLYAMRWATALICAALLGLAALALRLWSRSPWPLVGLVLGATPILVYSTAIVAPNGVELSAAALVWSALLGLCRPGAAPSPALQQRLLVLATVGAAPLVTVRTLGPLWLVLIVATVVLLAPRDRRRGLLGSRTAWAGGAVVASCALAAAAWTHAAGTNSLSGAHHFEDSPWPLLPQLEVLWLLQSMAAFPARDELAAPPLYVLVGAAWWLLLAIAARRGSGRVRLVLAVSACVSLAVPAAVTVATYATEGLVWQGRYGYPYSLGFWLLCGLALDRVGPAPRPVRGLVVALTLVWGAGQAIGLVGVLLAQRRTSPLADSPAWLEPPVWMVLALTSGACVLVGLALLRTAPGHRSRPAPSARPARTGPVPPDVASGALRDSPTHV